MNKNELAKKIYHTSHITGDFLLRSGKRSNEYFDKYLFESDPVLLKAIAEHMSPLVPKDTEILGGLEMGGIPLASAVSLITGMPVIFVRKEAKSYGTCKFAEGIDFANKHICLIEDVVTTGGQIIKSAEQLRSAGGIVNSVLSVIVREDAAFEKLNDAGLQLFPLFSMNDLKKYAD